MARLRGELVARAGRVCAQPLVELCLALAPLRLPSYVVLWLVEWLHPRYRLLPPAEIVRVIQSVFGSCERVRGLRDGVFLRLFLSRVLTSCLFSNLLLLPVRLHLAYLRFCCVACVACACLIRAERVRVGRFRMIRNINTDCNQQK